MAEEIKQNISVDSDLKGLDDFANKAEKSTQKTLGLAGALGKLNQAAKGDPTGKLNQSLNQISQSANKAASSVKRAGTNISNAGKRAQNAGGSIGSLATQMTRLTRITFIQLFLRQFFQFQQAVMESVQGAGEFERALAEIRTISGEAKLSFEEMSQSLTRISENIGVARIDLAAAAYQALSAQVADTSNVFTMVDTSAKLATATLSTTKESVDALSSVMNSFGASAGATEDIAGKLFKTIELGRIRMGELSKVIGRVAPLAAELGVSLDETLAGLAALTLSGVNAAEAGTLLSNVMLKLIKPTEALAGVYAELGVQSGEVLIAQEGFRGALDKIAEAGGGSSKAMGELFGRIRALRAALSLTGRQAETFDATLAKIRESGAKDLQEAFDEIKDTNFQELQRNIQQLSNTIEDTFGVTMLKAVNKFFDFIGGADKIMNRMVQAFIVGGATILAAWIVYMGGVSGALVGVQVIALETAAAVRAAWTIALGPAGLLLLVATATAALASMYMSARQESARFAEDQKKQLDDIAKAAEKNAKSTVKMRSEVFERDLAHVLKLADEANKVMASQFASAKAVADIWRTDLGNQIDEKIKAIFDVIDGVRKVAVEAREAMLRLPKLQRQVQTELQTFNFEVSLEQVSDGVKQANMLLDESNRKGQEAFAFAQRGLKEEAKAAHEAAMAYADRARAVALGAGEKGQSAYNQAVQQGRKLILEQVSLERTLQQARLANAKAALPLVKDLQLAATASKIAKDQIKELGDALGKGEISQSEFDKQVKGLMGVIQKALENSQPIAQKLAAMGFEDLASKLAVGPEIFDPITGELESIGEASKRITQNVTEFIAAQVRELNPVLQDVLKDLNIELTLEGIPLFKQQMADVKKELAELANGSAEFIAAQENLSEAQENTATSANRFNQEVRQLTPSLTGGLKGLQDLVNDVTSAKTAYDRFTGAVKAENLEGARQAFLDFSEAWKRLGDDPAVTEGMMNALGAMNKGMEQQLNALKVTTNKEFQGIQQRVDELQSVFGEAARNSSLVIDSIKEVGPASAGTGATIRSNVADGIQAYKDLGDAADAAKKKMMEANSASAGAKDARFGGQPIIYRAAGGLTRGLDTALVAMNPSEMVMTASATRRNFPALSAANAGVTPVFRQQGGTVHNEIGNISVNVTESAAPRSTAREVLAGLKREMRRGTAFFRGN